MRLYELNFAIAFSTQMLFVLANSLLTHYGRWISFLGGDERDIGWITGVGAVTSLFIRPWSARWIDRIGAHRAWTIGYLIFIGSIFGNLWVTRVGWEIYLLRIGIFVGVALVTACGLTYITQTAPPGRKTEAIGVFGASGFLGMLFGPRLGDFFLGGNERTTSDFTYMFLVAVAAVSFALVLHFTLRRPEITISMEGDESPKFWTLARRYWPGTVMVVSVVFGVCMTVPFVFLAKFLDVVGLQEMGPFFFYYAGWGLFVRIFMARSDERLDRRVVLIVGMILYGVGSFSFLMVDPAHAWRLIIPALVCGTGHALAFHTMMGLALEPFPPAVRGTGSVLALMFMEMGFVAGGPILGYLAYYWGYETLFFTVGMACIASAVFFSVAHFMPHWLPRSKFFQFNAIIEPQFPPQG